MKGLEFSTNLEKVMNLHKKNFILLALVYYTQFGNLEL
jgi:hypothetical protein